MKFIENNKISEEYLKYRYQQHQYTNLWLFLITIFLGIITYVLLFE